MRAKLGSERVIEVMIECLAEVRTRIKSWYILLAHHVTLHR